MKKLLLLTISCLMFGACASSVYYEYDKEQEKWIPQSKLLNRGMGVKADHKDKKLENTVIKLPDIEWRD